eukprot:CAMPEP_0204845198 /NCGR_PEP_ID=MMETSP1347-20130617/962_1 /ASSEMBLY_ACC=CAM_ASM_000690 /TAXON_ID=215587 /ORGANISM="Aplanochytrium stocchinoi, Strain GSBS06" /LENGTH=217 /DNA_ID=CAMNT_0051985135 /DNA_START=454 /DNA_END=1107 /DNA_ORIENTATION=+
MIDTPNLCYEYVEKQDNGPSREELAAMECSCHRKCNTRATLSQKSAKPWTFDEELILVGVVYDKYFLKGSLNHTQVQKESEDEDENCIDRDKSKGICWRTLKAAYEQKLRVFSSLKRKPCMYYERSTVALSRHFKVMKKKICDVLEKDPRSSHNFRELYRHYESLHLGDWDLVPVLRTSGADTRQPNANVFVENQANDVNDFTFFQTEENNMNIQYE